MQEACWSAQELGLLGCVRCWSVLSWLHAMARSLFPLSHLDCYREPCVECVILFLYTDNWRLGRGTKKTATMNPLLTHTCKLPDCPSFNLVVNTSSSYFRVLVLFFFRFVFCGFFRWWGGWCFFFYFCFSLCWWLKPWHQGGMCPPICAIPS